MKKAIRKVTYKMKSSVSQEESLMNLFVHHHQLYNWALRERIETYRNSDYALNFSEQCKINTLWRNNCKAHPKWLGYSLRKSREGNSQRCDSTLMRSILLLDVLANNS